MEARVAGAQVGDEEGVLVVVAGASEIGLAEDGHLHRSAHYPQTGRPASPTGRGFVTGSDGESHAGRFLPVIHSATWGCDESRPPLGERQRPLVVSLSQHVPCSHDPRRAGAPGLGARVPSALARVLRAPARPCRRRPRPAGPAPAMHRARRRRRPGCPPCQPVRGPLAASGRLSAARCRAADPRFQLRLRIRRHRRRAGDGRRPAAPGSGPTARGWPTWRSRRDSLMQLRIEARTDRDSARLDLSGPRARARCRTPHRRARSGSTRCPWRRPAASGSRRGRVSHAHRARQRGRRGAAAPGGRDGGRR